MARPLIQYQVTAQTLGPNPTASLIDNFDDDSRDTSKWTQFGAGIAEANRQLEMTTQAAGGYMGYTSLQPHKLESSTAHIRLVNAGNQSIVSLEVYPVQFYTDSNNNVFWLVAGGAISAYKRVGGVTTQLATTTYLTNVHKWLRLREQSGTTYWEYSENGTTWVTFHSAANPIPVVSGYIEISTGTWQAEAQTTTAKLDNFNVTTWQENWRPDNEPPLTNQRKRLQYAYPSFSGPEEEPAEQNDMDWLPLANLPRWDVIRQQYLYPADMGADAFSRTQAEAMLVSKWLPQTPDVVFDRARSQHTYPSFWFDPSDFQLPVDLTVEKWVGQYPNIIFDRQRNQYSYPTYFGLEDEPKEQFDADWFPLANLPRWDVQRQQYTYPHLSYVEVHNPIVTDWLGHHPDIVFDKQRLQYTYQFFFKEMSVLFHHCPPLTGWDEVTTREAAWSEADPVNTDWTQTAEIDAVVLAYDDSATDYDSISVYFDGYDPALLEGTLADPKNTDWSQSDPPSTGWSEADPSSTEWDECGGSEG